MKMINLSVLGQFYIVCEKTDMRRGIDSLSLIIKEDFERDPMSGEVVLFGGAKQDSFKALYWDGQDFWLLYKRFENGKLNWPSGED